MSKIMEKLKNMKNKKLVLSIGIIGIVLLVVGTTYAFYSYGKQGSKEHIIKSGSITFHYSEDSQGLTLNDALPMTDAQGMAGNYFEFSVEANTSRTIDIPYYITARRSGTGTNMDNIVKVYLTKVENGVEQPVEVVTGKQIAKFSELSSYTNSNGINIPAEEKKLHQEMVYAGEQGYREVYRLRMWIDESTEWVVQDSNGEATYPYNGKTYTLKVNVYSSGDEVGENALVTRNDASISSIGLGEQASDIAVTSGNNYSGTAVTETGKLPIEVTPLNPNSKVEITKTDSTFAKVNEGEIRRLSTRKEFDVTTGLNYFKIVVKSEDRQNIEEYHLTLDVLVGSFSYDITSSGLNSNKQVTLSANETKEINITLTSNTTINSKYELYYIPTNEDVEVGYYEDMGANKGTIAANGTVNMKLILKNKTNSSNTLTFGVDGGFTSKTLTLGTGHKVLDSVIESENVTGNYVAYLSNGLNKNLSDLQITGNTSSSTKVGQSGTINLVVSGKNLVNIANFSEKNRTENGYSLTYRAENQTLYLNGQIGLANSTTGIFIYLNNPSNLSAHSVIDMNSIETGQTYKTAVYTTGTISQNNDCKDLATLSNEMKKACNTGRLGICIHANTSQTIGDCYIQGNYEKTSLVNSLGNTNYIFVQSYSNYNNVTFKAQVERGETKTAYEPYKEMRYAIALKNVSGTTINGLGSGDVLKKVNGKWVIQNGNTNTELHSSTQNALNNILIYDGISNVWIDDDIPISNINVTYLKKEAISNN